MSSAGIPRTKTSDATPNGNLDEHWPASDQSVAICLDTTVTLTTILREVIETLSQVPYVQSVAGIVLQIINIEQASNRGSGIAVAHSTDMYHG